MNREALFTKVQNIIRDVLDDETLSICEDTQAHDIENWDSLAHISIITSIEKDFQKRFSISEIDSFENVGDIITALEKKLA